MAKMSKRTHDERIKLLEKTMVHLHDNTLPALQAAIAERDSVIHACTLQLAKLDPTRTLRKVKGEKGMFYLFASDEELAEIQKAAEVDADAKADDTV